MLLVPPRDDEQRKMLEIEAKQHAVTVWIGESGREAFKCWIDEVRIG